MVKVSTSGDVQYFFTEDCSTRVLVLHANMIASIVTIHPEDWSVCNLCAILHLRRSRPSSTHAFSLLSLLHPRDVANIRNVQVRVSDSSASSV
jgi:hypothetical protein